MPAMMTKKLKAGSIDMLRTKPMSANNREIESMRERVRVVRQGATVGSGRVCPLNVHMLAADKDRHPAHNIPRKWGVAEARAHD